MGEMKAAWTLLIMYEDQELGLTEWSAEGQEPLMLRQSYILHSLSIVL